MLVTNKCIAKIKSFALGGRSFIVQLERARVGAMMIYRSIKTAFFAAIMVGLTGFADPTTLALSGSNSTAHAASLLASPYARLNSGDNKFRSLTRDRATVFYVAEDCASVGQKVAAAQGGTLTKATSAVQNGAPVCVVVVLVPGRAGERPRRVEVAVPAK